MDNLTVLYYSSNREDTNFENKIMENVLKQKGDLPLVSVTQKPVDFGKNIYVGVHDNCYKNEFRQIQIGLNEVKTKWVITTEADCLYPPEYFQFMPAYGNCWRYVNVWIHYIKEPKQYGDKPIFHYKGRSDGAQVVSKDAWLELINKNLDSKKEWFDKDEPYIERCQLKSDGTFFGDTRYPVVSFKTHNGIGKLTQIKDDTAYELPYWGSIENIRKEVLNG